MATLSYDELLEQIATYCQRQDDVLALLVVGSRAQPHQKTDAYSDLDLILFTDRPGKYAADVDWLGSLSGLWITAHFSTSVGDFEWQVLFQGGLKMDIVLAPAAAGATVEQALKASGYRPVLEQGWTAAYALESPLLVSNQLEASYPVSQEQIGPHMAVNRALVTLSRCLDFFQRGDYDRFQKHFRGPLQAHIGALREASGSIAGPHPPPGAAERGDVERLRQLLALVSERAADLKEVDRQGFGRQGQSAAITWLQGRLADYPSPMANLPG